jgi:hypothetical protein
VGLRPDEVIAFYQFTQSLWPHWALEFTQLLTEINTRGKNKKKFLGSTVGPVREADNLTVICDLIVWTMWDPQHPTIL